jgi:hypothetical protein
MKKTVFLLFLIVLWGCSVNDYKQLKNGNIMSPDKIEYIFLAGEEIYVLFGERSFVSHIMWQPRKLRHLGGNIDAGVYSINHDPNQTILRFLKYNSEFGYIYLKKELSGNNYSFTDCNSFKFFDTGSTFAGYYRANIEHLEVNIGIDKAEDVNNFVENIKSNEIYTNKKFINFLINPFDVKAVNDGFIGYIYGFYQEIPNLAFPGTVWTKENGLYYLVMDRRIFNISIEWLRKLGYSE